MWIGRRTLVARDEERLEGGLRALPVIDQPVRINLCERESRVPVKGDSMRLGGDALRCSSRLTIVGTSREDSRAGERSAPNEDPCPLGADRRSFLS